MKDLSIHANIYVSLYVSFKDFGDGNVISFGKNAVDVYNSTVALGYDDPVIVFIEDGTPQITSFTSDIV